MSYTRRRVIRDAGLMSLAGSGFSPFLTGCHCNSFDDGIRIFFEGAWLFCAHSSDSSLMLAITVNPISQASTPPQETQPVKPVISSDKGATVKDQGKDPCDDPMDHIFPYGIWDEADHWDQKHRGTQLSTNQCVPSNDGKCYSMPAPHRIFILGHWKRQSDVDALFRDADTTSRFTYHPNQGGNSKVQWGTPELRVISLPIPSRIVPAAFRTRADIVDQNGNSIPHRGNSGEIGVATTHIFDYPGAHYLLFVPQGGDAVEVDHGRDFHSDFHFHTVPARPQDPCSGHDKMMFAKLVNLLSSPPQFNLQVTNPFAKVEPGLSVPSSVKPDELEIGPNVASHPCPSSGIMTSTQVNLATCGSGVIGSGGGH